MIFFYVLISAMPLMRHPFWSGFFGDLTMIKYAGAASFAYAFLYLGVRRTSPQFLRTAQSRWFLLFAAMAITSYVVWGIPVPFEISPFMSYLSFLVFLFVTLTLIDSQQRLRWTLLVVIGSVGYASLHVLREWQNMGFAAGYRPGWMTGDPNYFSLSALLCLPVTYYFLTMPQPKWERWFCLACLGVTTLALVAASSRGGFLGFMVAVLFVAWRSPQRSKVIAICCVVLLPLLLVAPSSPLSRLLNPDRSDQAATDSRLALWRAGVNMVVSNPIVGVGAGNFKAMARRYGDPSEGDIDHVAHNTYIEIAAEVGLPAFLVFMAILRGTFRTLGRIRRRTQEEGPALIHRAAQGLQAGLLGYCVSVFFVSAQTHKLFWLVVFLCISMESLVLVLNRRSQSTLRVARMAA